LTTGVRSRVTTAWASRCVAALCLGFAVHIGATASLSIADLRGANWPGPLVSNDQFAPPIHAAPAHEPFVGTVSLAETRMKTLPGEFKPATILGRDPQLFPAVNLAFFTVADDLVPVTQEVILAGSTGQGRSYWDLIVQPGAVWSLPDDQGWSRAGFPFALVNALEGETHNGVATFAYKRGKVTHVRVQILQQTAPYYVVDYFTATAQIETQWAPQPPAGIERAQLRYRAAMQDRLEVRPWRELEARFSKDRLASFDDGKSADIVVSALDYDGKIYLKPCNTAAGPLPWCERTRFGVWSATKSLVNGTALLHLAQKYGPGIFAERIADFVPQAAAFPGWANVRFADAVNMTTGVGNGSLTRNPNNILDGALVNYAPWYEARTQLEKIQATLTGATPFPWGPGQVARYRDQDMFMLGIAMDNYVKKKEGAAASIWNMVSKEVFEPIGIHDAPINKTLEPAGREGQPLMAFGYYPTISDIARVARLYQNFGAYKGQQLLYAPKIREIFARTPVPGLPTGEVSPFGEVFYFNTFWKAPYTTPRGCKLYYPQMEGWGGTVVALFPGKLTGIRIAKIWEDDTHPASATSGMAAVADQLEGFALEGGC
jgi:CubicO group peptidase (beta-lactamase class C family)